jgi:DNA-directed RNA polymerase subunit E'/Rpb7
MVSFISKHMITTSIYIEAKDVNIDLNSNIMKILVNKIEGKCNDIGYVLKDSTKIINRSMGKIVYLNGINNVKYNIKYTCNILTPTVGETIKCCIESITDAGVIGYIKMKDIDTKYTKDNDISETPIICIIPLNRFENPDQILKNQRVNIKITAVRNKFNQLNIHIVGSPV